jgi:DNA-binding transcriptional ArsR family regulator
MADDDLDLVFAALSDPTRRALLAQLARGAATVTELAAPHEMSIPSVSRHLATLERAGLVSKSVDAQWRRCSLDAAPLHRIDVWLTPYRRFFESRLDRLENYLEDTE